MLANPRSLPAGLDQLAEASKYAPFDLLGTWMTIKSEPPPLPLPDPPALPPADEPSAAILEVHAATKEARHLGNATATVVITIGLAINHGLWWVWIALGIICRAIAVMISAPNKRPYRNALKSAMKAHEKLLIAYRNECGSGPFDSKLRELNQLKENYQEAIFKAIDEQRITSLKRHLESHVLTSGTVSGIGTSRIQMLEESGITTAADIDKSRIDRIPGFGLELSERLVEWRKEVKETFAFSPSNVALDSMIQSLEGLLHAGMREHIEAILSDGPRNLRVLRESSHERRAIFLESLTKTAKDLAQRQMEYNLVK